MQQEVNIMCQKHNEKIIFVNLTESGESLLKCMQCLTENVVSIEKLVEQLTNLRQEKIKNLIEQGNTSEKRLGSVKKVFIAIRDQFACHIQKIIKDINDEMTSMNQSIKNECELLKQPIENLNKTQLCQHIKELKQKKLISDDRIKQDTEIRNQIIQNYFEFFESLNKLIQKETNWETQTKSDNIAKKSKIVITEVTKQCYNQYKTQKEVTQCYAMAMDKDEKILINGQWKYIQVWDFDTYGTMNLNQILSGHTDYVRSLCFSKKRLYFLSGSDDKSIRIWGKNDKEEDWFCQQVLQNAHDAWVLGIQLNKDEDQFISYGRCQTINVWMFDKGWKLSQTLEGHSGEVHFISFNHDCSLLASTGDDGLRIWQKGNYKLWIENQLIKNADKYLRIKFINKNELIASTQKGGQITRFVINSEGKLEVASQIKLNNVYDSEYLCFPIIWDEKLQLAIIKVYMQIYVLQYNNGEFLINQVFEGDFKAGYLLKDGKYLILFNYTRGIEILN